MANLSSRIAAFAPPVIVTLFGLVFILWSYSYGERARQVPLIVGYTLVFLSMLDIIATSQTTFGHRVKSFFTGTLVGGDENDGQSYPLGRVLLAMAWPLGFVTSVYFFGFILVIPVFVFLFVVIQGRSSMRRGLMASVITSSFIYIVFEQLLKYEIFAGIVFGD